MAAHSDQERALRRASESRSVSRLRQDLVGRHLILPRSAQDRPRVHHDLVAGQGHHGGIGAGFVGDVGHGADLVAGKLDEVVGQPLALQRGAAGAVDPQADEIRALAALLVDDAARCRRSGRL